jgi:hypothetical protein
MTTPLKSRLGSLRKTRSELRGALKSATDETIREAKLEMENAIYLAVDRALSTFQAETGRSPCRVDVVLMDVTTLCEPEERYLVSGVHAHVSV